VGERHDADGRALTALPAVHELAAALDAPRALAVAAARRAIAEERDQILAGQPASQRLLDRAGQIAAELQRPSLRRVLNATGVIVHTNLGRAPLPAAARDAVAATADGYSNLELDLDTGERGSRQTHIEHLLGQLSGAEAALAVNNGAAAVLLAAAALAGPERAIIVSRGQLVEIGGGFRIPEVIAQSGSELIEVGTTNRTSPADYRHALDAVGDRAGAILRVHQSNFRALGFVSDVEIEELCALDVPVIDDVGSGVLIPRIEDEPSLSRSVAAGATLVCCSGDKLLGGPQAGLLVGSSDAVSSARSHPLSRAMRIDKLSLAALEATLSLYRDPQRARREVPVLAMLSSSEEELAARAERIRAAIGSDAAEVVWATAKVGGGALPLLELEGPVVAIDDPRGADTLASALRAGEPPVIARIRESRVLLDPRTLTDEEADLLAAAVRTALP
jgi:L-seryl-tRNA(Ser) seleniumtransferase